MSYTSPERAVPPTDEPTGSQQSQTSPVEHALGAAAIPPRSPPRTAAGLGMPVSDSDRSVGGESSHMTETITDIQQAIEQLAVTSSTSMNGIESRSMRSFQSREDSHYDDSIIDGAIKDDAGDETEHDVGWSATTRQRLAEKAMSENKKREQKEMDKEIKRREREETEKQSWGAGGIPHGVEFSDESEDELDDHAGIHAVSTTSPHGIEPIDHRLGSDPSSSPLVDGAAPLAVPVAAPVSLDRVLSDASPVGHSPELANTNTNGNESHFAVGVAASSGRAEPPSELAYTSAEDLTPGQRATRALESAVSEPSAVSQEPSPYHTVVPDQPAPNSPPTTTTSASAPADASRALGTPVSLATPTLPASSPTHAPATTTPSEQVFNNPFTHQQDGAGTGTPSPASVIDGGARPASPTKSSSRRPSSMSTTGLGAAGVPGEPLEWGIDEVVEWAKRRGFGADIYDKFLGQSSLSARPSQTRKSGADLSSSWSPSSQSTRSPGTSCSSSTSTCSRRSTSLLSANATRLRPQLPTSDRSPSRTAGWARPSDPCRPRNTRRARPTTTRRSRPGGTVSRTASRRPGTCLPARSSSSSSST